MPKFLVTCERLVTVCLEVEADSKEAAIALYHEGSEGETFEAISDTKPPEAHLLEEEKNE